MEFIEGQIVLSAAGHDKGMFFVVMEIKGGFAFIADGKRRKVNSPKRKSLKHLKPTNTVINPANLTDKKLRSVIREFTEQHTVTNETGR